MLKVLNILKRDFARLVHTPPALAVVLALLILPSMYTWYNVVAFWNPYDNTGNLRVCVVNQDAGGSSELTGSLNVGDKIVAQLEDNQQLQWYFTTYDDAMAQLESGQAYGVYVIPANFTENLLTLTTGSFIQPKLQYYVNEKLGPVSPKITDTGANTLDRTINSAFVSTVSEAAVQALDEAMEQSRTESAESRSRAATRISNAASEVEEARGVLATLRGTTAEAQQKAASARQSLAAASTGLDEAEGGLGEVAATALAMEKTLRDFSAFAMPAVTKSASALTTASSKAHNAAASLNSSLGQAQGGVQSALAQGTSAVGESRALAASLRTLAGNFAQGSAERTALETAAQNLEAQSDAAQQTLDSLTSLNGRVNDTSQKLADATSALDGAVNEAAGGLTEYSDGLFGTTLPAVNEALSALAETSNALNGALAAQRLLIDQTDLVIEQLDATMATAYNTVQQTDGLFADLESQLGVVYNDVMAFGASDALTRLFGNEALDANRIASFMASPTEVVTEQLYPLNAYGSAMAPLFMNLTFWIGAFMLLVILRQEVDEEGVGRLTLGQRYWGRFLFLAPLAVCQALICCAGVLIIGVQAVNALALFAAAVLASLAYLSIIYAFSVTLQHIGKGICIVLVFAQIPGATGLYPIEMTSGFFQSIYPLFPFTYGIGAMREAICGFYGTQYATDLLVLALFLAAFIALGLLLRPVMANVNRMVARQVREGGLFAGEKVEVPARPYRLAQIMKVLSDRGGYGRQLEGRYQRFLRWYPRLMRGALVAGVAVPVVLAVVFALTPAEKVWLLTGWLLWVVVVFVALVVIESLRYSYERQMHLNSLTDDRLIGLYDAEAGARAAAEAAERASKERYMDHG